MASQASTSFLPTANVPIALRSGFHALPFIFSSSSKSPSRASTPHWIYARIHESNVGGDDAEQEGEGREGMLFVTGIAHPCSLKSIKATFTAVYPGNKITAVQFLEGESTIPTLLEREKTNLNPFISPLFNTGDASTTSTDLIPLTTHSAIITFSSTPSLPPLSFGDKSIPRWITPSSSYLAATKALHSIARPHLSSIIAHSDSWMTTYDLSLKTKADLKLVESAKNHGVLPPSVLSKSAKKTKKGKNGKPLPSTDPLPGSAAHALATHITLTAQLSNKAFNPDEVVEEEWKLVTRGGQHGTSLLPTGVTVDVSGYGGARVAVARKRKLGEEEVGGVEEHRIIVGEGFYRFRKEDGRRAGESLLSLCDCSYSFVPVIRTYESQSSIRGR